MIAVLGQLGVLFVLAAAGLFLTRMSQLAKRRARQLILPAVPRENWSEEDWRLHAARHPEELAVPPASAASSHLWQMHRALDRLTANAAGMASNLSTWRAMAADLDRQAERCAEQARVQVEAGRDEDARASLVEGHRCERRAAQFRDDVARVDAMLTGCRREMAELEERLGTELRRTAVADARLATARDTLRARQLAHGTLAEAAMARREKIERAADRVEAEAEVLAMGASDGPGGVDGAFARLEADAAVEQRLAVLRFGRRHAAG